MSGHKVRPLLRSPYLTPIDPSAPLDVARQFLAREFSVPQGRTLHHHRGAFYAWSGAAYIEIAADDLRAKLYKFLDQCQTNTGDKIKHW